MNRKWLIPISAFFLVLISLTMYFSTNVNGKEPKVKSKPSVNVKETLAVIGSKEELNQHFLKILKKQKRENALYSDGKTAEMESINDSSKEMKSNDSSKSDHSETNNQVAGVDEADNIKTNGTHVFQVSDGKVRIVKAVPANRMEVLSTISYDDSFFPNELFLHGDQLVVIGYGTKKLANSKSSSINSKIIPMFHSTKAIIYNVQNPKNPQIIRGVEVEGQLVQSRKMDGKVYLVSNYYPDYWILDKDSNLDLRPKYIDSTEGSKLHTIDYHNIQYFSESQEANYTIISTINLDKPKQKVELTTYLGSGRQIYMSRDNLYIAVSKSPFSQLLLDTMVSPNTSIYKFSVKDTAVKFQGSTEVPGTVLNQFSMDEHNGYFRVATTEGAAWDNKKPSANHLFILDKNLMEVGSLKDLARGERIYSARFLGNRIYVVTFKETDPLFVIDAKNPKNPTVLGELKIPGFSNYLHPLDENHLIGFGYNTKIISEKGFNNEPRITTNGVKISLFDVSDMSHPKEKFNEIIGGSGTYSPLNFDHKALLFQQDRNLLAFPISVYENVEGAQFEQKFTFQGGYIYQIDKQKGFKLLKKVSHMTEDSPYEEWENNIQRFIYIGENIYAISLNKISSYQMNDFVQIGEIGLK